MQHNFNGIYIYSNTEIKMKDTIESMNEKLIIYLIKIDPISSSCCIHALYTEKINYYQ